MRVHRALLRLYPASFRAEYGGEMGRIFARRHRDASGSTARLRLWLEVIADTMANATRVHVEILRQDLRHTARALRRAPGFALTAVLVSALGVGATTAAFSLADHVLLRPLPFPDPDRIVKIWQTAPAYSRMDVAPPNYRDWKTMATSFAAMGTYAQVSANLVGRGDPARLDGADVSAELLDVMGVRPARGRAFLAADDRAGAPGTVLLSDALWHAKFGAEAGIIGRAVVLDDEPCVVIGVMPEGFEFPARGTAFWRPIRFRPDAFDDRGNTYLRVMARLKPDVSRARAVAEMNAVAAAIEQAHPKENAKVGATAISLRDEIAPQSRQLLLGLVGAAACVLLIACTNLASLLVARAAGRARELAVRTAMGAGRERLVRQLLTESLLLAAVGGGLGLLLALAAVPLAVRLVPTSLPIAEAPGVDLRMLLMAAVVTLGTGLGFGVWPAFRAARHAGADGLRDGARAGSSRRTERVRAALVVAQVGASVVLLVSAGLLIRALWQVQATDPGFRAEGVLTMRTTLPWSQYGPQATRVKFYRRVIDDVTALPGVTGAAYTSFLPIRMRGGIWPVVVPGRPQDPDAGYAASARFVTPEYFRVMGIPLKSGRVLDDSDSLRAEPTAVVSASFGREYLDGASPVGKHFGFGPGGERTIVGVVGDVLVRGLERASEPQVYLPYQQQADGATMFYTPKDLVVRVAAGSAEGALSASIRRIIATADPQQPISDVQPLSAIVEGDSSARAAQVSVLGAFAAVACTLAAIGLHGLLAFVVSARTHEFGVRLALGARPSDIVGMVVWRGLQLSAVGLVTGVGLACLAGRSMQALLVGLSPADVPTISAAVGISFCMTLAGSLAPALGAARTNPTEALRAD